jgi:hypothetical protein
MIEASPRVIVATLGITQTVAPRTARVRRADCNIEIAA